jgi:hypothetical protein
VTTAFDDDKPEGSMCRVIVTLVGFAGSVSGPARADDGIVVQSMRVEGVIPKKDDPLFDVNPYRKDRVPYANINGLFRGGELYVVVTKGESRALVCLDFGGDKKLKEQAEKLVGQRVVVECKGEYSLHTRKVNVPQRQGSAEEEQPFASLTLTVVRIEPAK